jgi:glycosyltransferase involved in cell wall biosynthesis
MSVIFARMTGKRTFVTDVGGGGWVSLARVLNVARYCHGLLLLSRFANQSFRPGPPQRWVVYGGVDTDRFHPAARLPNRQVVFVGRLLPHKGIDYLIEAMPENAALKIVGRPYNHSYLQRLRNLARHKQVEFVLDATDERVIAEYQSATVSVLPSVDVTGDGVAAAAPELLGLAALEAMACGTAVVCSGVGSLPEIVENGTTGYVVPPRDVEQLSNRIVSLLDDPARAREMGATARQRVLERFTWEQVASVCLNAYAGKGADPNLGG